MYRAIANFSYQNFETDPVTLIGQIINEWRDNGQIIGREFGVTFHEDHFQVQVAIPEQESLLPKWNNMLVAEAQAQAEEAGVKFASFEILGRDYQADETGKCDEANFLILYTTHLDSCSPLRGKDLKPVPIYRLTQDLPYFGRSLIQWQENWQACDQLQMNGDILEAQALAQISEVQSPLTTQGRELAALLEAEIEMPVYYYLYRLGQDKNFEHQRKCPHCGGEWKLPEPLYEIFHFKCERCRLVSNISWEVL